MYIVHSKYYICTIDVLILYSEISDKCILVFNFVYEDTFYSRKNNLIFNFENGFYVLVKS